MARISRERALSVKRRPGPDGVGPFEIRFGGKPRFVIESSNAISGGEVLASAPSFELVISLINRAERLVPTP